MIDLRQIRRARDDQLFCKKVMSMSFKIFSKKYIPSIMNKCYSVHNSQGTQRANQQTGMHRIGPTFRDKSCLYILFKRVVQRRFIEVKLKTYQEGCDTCQLCRRSKIRYICKVKIRNDRDQLRVYRFGTQCASKILSLKKGRMVKAYDLEKIIRARRNRLRQEQERNQNN